MPPDRPLPKGLAYADRAHHLEFIRSAALAAADPERALHAHLSVRGRTLLLGRRRIQLPPGGRLFLVAIGKAGPAMAAAARRLLGDLLSMGIVTEYRPSSSDPKPRPIFSDPRLQLVPGEHPLPGPGSLRAGRAVERMLQGASRQDLLLVLISGGGSSMFELPIAGISLDDLRATNRLLLRCGAPIADVNRVRSALSRLKAGGLARLAWPAATVALILSDVVGDRLSAVASGPTVLHARRAPTARQVLRRYGVWEAVPASVRAAVRRPPARRLPARRPLNRLVGSNRLVVAAAGRAAEQLGFRVQVVTTRMHGPARRVGERLGGRLMRAGPGSCLLLGGETTVEVRGAGRGGRNQELALAAARELAGSGPVALMALATDGIDGPTDAAGAAVDDTLWQQAVRLGLDPSSALRRNDVYPVLRAVGALIHTGPTATNLNDLVVGLRYPS